MPRLAIVVGLLAGCIESSSTVCGDGQLCPAGTTCVPLPTIASMPNAEMCAKPGDVAACQGKAENDTCASGVCHDGVCMPVECGNGYIDPGEACDDHNNNSGDGCSADCLSTEVCGNGVRDGITFEECDDGNLLDGDGCDSRCRPEQPRWISLATNQITARRSVMAYDAAHDQMVLFSGIDPTNTTVLGADTWLWNGRGWTRAAPRSAPTARRGQAMAYDPVHHQVVLFGGFDSTGQYQRDTWLWDGHEWALAPTSSAPSQREGAAMAFDSRLGRVILFGGHFHFDFTDLYFADTWSWDGTTWTKLQTATTPEPRSDGGMTYDPVHDRIVMFGGATTGVTALAPNKTWVFDGTDWSSSTPAGSPSARRNAQLGWDATSHAVLLFGGQIWVTIGTSTIAADLSDTYSWNGTSWTPYNGATKPANRSGYALGAAASRGVVTLFGGSANENPPQTWQWNGTTWANVSPTAPNRQVDLQATFDPLRGRAIKLDKGTVPGSTLEHDGGAWISNPAVPVSRPEYAGLEYDLAHRQAVMFGGVQYQTGQYDNETWLYNGASWTQVSPANSPTARTSPLAYDAAHQRTILFSGFQTLQALAADTWAWDGTTWIPLAPPHAPTARAQHVIGYDWIRQRVVLFGGGDGVSSFGDTWTFDGTDWHQETPMTSPPARTNGAMVWNPRRGALTLFGGYDGGPMNDTWEWNGSGWMYVATSSVPPARVTAAMFRSGDGFGLDIFGGSPGGLAINDYFDNVELRWDGLGPVETCVLPIDLDGDGKAGCADPDCFFVCNPTCTPGAACDPGAPHCGDGTCSAIETCRMCPQDCGACPPMCGDTYCDAGETSASCPGDCP